MPHVRFGDVTWICCTPAGSGRSIAQRYGMGRAVVCLILVLIALWPMEMGLAEAQGVSRVALRNFRLGLRALRTGDKRVETAALSLARAIASARLSRDEVAKGVGPPPWTLGNLLDKLASDPRLNETPLPEAIDAYADAREQYTRAVTVFESLERMTPELVDASLMRGLGLLCLGETQQALAALQKAVEAGVGDLQALKADGLSLALKDGVRAERLPEIGEALAKAVQWPALGSGAPETAGYRFGYGPSGVVFDFDASRLVRLVQQREELDLFAEIDHPRTEQPPPPVKKDTPTSEPPEEQEGDVAPVTRPVARAPDSPKPPVEEKPKDKVRTEEKPKAKARVVKKKPEKARRPEPPKDRPVAARGRAFPTALLAQPVSAEDSLNALRSLELGRRELLRGKNMPSVAQARAEAEDVLNRGLQENGVTRAVLKEIFPEFPVPLNTFLKRLEETYQYDAFRVVKDYYWLVSQKLERASAHLDQAIRRHPRLLDAYFEKMRLALDMDWPEEAVRAYEVARLLPLDLLRQDSREVFDLDPLGPVVEETVLRVARLYHEKPDLVEAVRRGLAEGRDGGTASSSPDTTSNAQEPEAVRLIRKFSADRAELIEKRKASDEGDLSEVYVLENRDVWNRFLLVQFYRDIGWRDQAEPGFKMEKKRVGARLLFERDQYANVIAALAQLQREIATMKRPMVVNFQIVGDLASKLNVRARVTFLLRPENPDASVTVRDLDIAMIPGHQSNVSFRKEVSTKLVTGEVVSLPEGTYTVIIEIPELPILKPNTFPLRVSHQFRNTRSQEFLQPELQITVRGSKGDETRTSLASGSYTQAGGTLMFSQKKQVEFPAGVARVKATAELQYQSDFGTIYGLHLQLAEGVKAE